MWQLDRLTTSRVARCSAMRTRVLRARRSRATFLSMWAPLLLLRFLDDHALADVTHALALVRLRRTVGADLRSDLPDLLLVDALDHDFSLRGRLDLDALRHRVHDRVREPERQVDLVAR